MGTKTDIFQQDTASVASVSDLVFDLKRAAHGEHSAHDLGTALCDLEVLVGWVLV